MAGPNPKGACLPRLADTVLGSQLQGTGAALVEAMKGCGNAATARQLAASEVLLDEWQRTPRLRDAVRRAVDDRGRPGQFILTGSATPRDDIPGHSGAGRFGIIRMRTMTLTEKQATTPTASVADLRQGIAPVPAICPLEVRDYLHHVSVGGWPALVGIDEATARTFLDGYPGFIIDQDIDEVSGAARNPLLVRRFLHAYAQVVSQTATVSAILKRARGDAAAGTDAPSRYVAGPYLDALRRMAIVDEVPAWDPSARSSKRLVTTPKRHLGDPHWRPLSFPCPPNGCSTTWRPPASCSRASSPTIFVATPKQPVRPASTTAKPKAASKWTTSWRHRTVTGRASKSSSARPRSTRQLPPWPGSPAESHGRPDRW